MTTTITAAGSGNTTSPNLIDGYEAGRRSRNQTIDLISGGIAVILVSPRPRSGTLELLYVDEAEAFAAVALHAEETVFTLESDERAPVNMVYVVGDGDVGIALDDETRDAWVVTIPFQEIT